MKNKCGWVCNLLMLLLACNRQVPINDIQHPPRPSEADRPFANVYQPLDGRWTGTFYIYQDTVGRPVHGDSLKNISRVVLGQLPLSLIDSIRVNQIYNSESPYFQKVTIVDYYPDQDKSVVSKGVNKVQDGKMWCIVRKPDETVLHAGSFEPPHTIIWQRQEEDPQRVEYFRETVRDETYEIVGWGYYEGDDLELMPGLWF